MNSSKARRVVDKFHGPIAFPEIAVKSSLKERRFSAKKVLVNRKLDLSRASCKRQSDDRITTEAIENQFLVGVPESSSKANEHTGDCCQSFGAVRLRPRSLRKTVSFVSTFESVPGSSCFFGLQYRKVRINKCTNLSVLQKL